MTNKYFLTFTASVLAITLLTGSQNIPEITVRGRIYTGKCFNETRGILAQLYLSLHQTGEKITGTLTFTAAHVGGGPLKGTIKGDNVNFVTSDDRGKITWTGQMLGKTICGNFLVEDPGGRIQRGIWSVRRK